jgi:nicotinamide riboside kinase
MTTLIAVTGPESTGKTSLARFLSGAFPGSHLIPEYAREWLETRPPGYRYTRDDFFHIAQKQHELIHLARRQPEGIFFLDTEHLVLDIWHSEVFGEHDVEIRRLLGEERFDLTLLCAPDLQWEFDPLRENPADRERLFGRYEEELNRLGRPYHVIRGVGPGRNTSALQLVRAFLQTSR